MLERKERVKEKIKDYDLKHSAAHILASAMKQLYPQCQLAIGPPLEDSFYYDFGNAQIKEEDLPKIEAEMKRIIRENHPFELKEVPRKEAEQMLKNEPFKQDILKEITGKITFYKHGAFMDLCEGPHVKSTGDIKAVKLTKVAGAYWKGDSKNPQLTRLYGVVFPSEKELKAWEHQQEEATKRDHVKLGRQLELYMFDPISPGSAFFFPKGAIIYNELVNFLREEYKKRGYQEVITPILYNNDLWKQSGHWEHFRENMFCFPHENVMVALKPMNCPTHFLMFKSRIWSYRDLPLRWADFGNLHRNELSGTLHGLTRVRKLSQDDSHIFLAPEQIEAEAERVLEFLDYIYSTVFKLQYEIHLSTKPDKAMGDPKLWETAENALKSVLKKRKLQFKIKEGEGAFYGPKIDVQIKDALGREWQCGTMQLDFQMPERFDLSYEGADGKRHRVIVIHRALLGSLERFIGILMENYAGKLPLWLNPVQVKVMTVNDRNIPFAEKIVKQIREANIRLEEDFRQESIGKKVRDAQLQYVNYMITVGDKEEQQQTLAIRTREGAVKFGVKPMDFLAEIRREIEEKR